MQIVGGESLQSCLPKRLNWQLEIGRQAPKKLVELCQDQWRKKDPNLPSSNAAYSENELLTIPWFNNVTVCHRCGAPCPCCRNKLNSEVPFEMSTAKGILHFYKIHENNDNTDENDDNGIDEQGGNALNEPKLENSQMGMQLRSGKRKHTASKLVCSNSSYIFMKTRTNPFSQTTFRINSKHGIESVVHAPLAIFCI